MISINRAAEKEKYNRSDASKFLIGFFTTLLMSIAGKLITMLLASQPISDGIVYLSDNYSFWMSVLTASGSAGYFALKWTHRGK